MDCSSFAVDFAVKPTRDIFLFFLGRLSNFHKMTATVHELLKLRKALEEDGHDASTLLDLLEQAASMQVTPQLLHQTLLGRTIATLKKSEHSEVSKRAKEVVLAWKSMVITEKTSPQPLPSSAAMIQSAPSRSQSCPKIAAPSSAPQSVSAPQPVQKHKTPPSPISITINITTPSPFACFLFILFVFFVCLFFSRF